MRSWGCDPHNGINVLKRPELFPLFAVWELSEKAIFYKPESSHHESNLSATWCLISQPPKLEEINVYYLSCPVYGVLLEQPELIKTGQKYQMVVRYKILLYCFLYAVDCWTICVIFNKFLPAMDPSCWLWKVSVLQNLYFGILPVFY